MTHSNEQPRTGEEAKPAEALTRPLVIYDGDCRFCRFWIALWSRSRSGSRLCYAPYQRAAQHFPGIGAAGFSEAVYLLWPSQPPVRAAEAVFRILAADKPRGMYALPLRLYRRSRLVRAASEAAYRFVARHREGFSRINRRLVGKKRFARIVASAPDNLDQALAA